MRGQRCPYLSWIGVARSSLDVGDVRTAEVAVTQAMQVDPGTAASADLTGRTLLMVAQARGDAGRSQALTADMMFQRAARLEPKWPRIAYHRGLAHLAANRPVEAAILLEGAVAADPADDNAVRALLLAYERSHQTERSKAFVEQLRQQGRLPPAGEPPGPDSRPAGSD
jgi:predicted Zn-dependent protease